MAEDQTTAPETEGTPAEGAEGTAAAAPNKKKKMLMMISAAVAVIGVLVAVGFIFLSGGKEEDADHEAEHAATPIPDIVTYDVPPFTVNLLQEEGASARYLKITLAIELKNAADSESMGKVLPRLQDDWGSYMRQLRGTDLQGSAAMQRLREGLLRRAMQTLDPIPVTAVYIRDMLVQ